MAASAVGATAAAALCSSGGGGGGALGTLHVAVIGGGISGACAASVLSSAVAGGAAAAAAASSAAGGGRGRRSSPSAAKARKPPPAIVEPAARTALPPGFEVRVDLFDQGRRGVGGRSSQRRATADDGSVLGWDHGCQFFRADTERFKPVVSDWIRRGFVSEWSGRFASDGAEGGDFFGMPSAPPFYVGSGGMQSVPRRLLELCAARGGDGGNGRDRGVGEGGGEIRDSSAEDRPEEINSTLEVFTGTRVSRMERGDGEGGDGETTTTTSTRRRNKWFLFGASGEAAYHDTPERAARDALAADGGEIRLGRPSARSSGYDAVLLTDLSSSFGTWHRASAGVPEDFAARVRGRVGARVPLFSALVAFDRPLDVPFDAASFGGSGRLWFAARSNSKPGMDGDGDGDDANGGTALSRDCWTLVSTPEYALEKIEETPMQDPETGEFVPQSGEYLTSVPGPELEEAFREALASTDGVLGSDALDAVSIPATIYLDAQRWGSAMPCHRHLDERSPTRRVVSGVPYDSGRAPLAPTRLEDCRDETDDANFLADDGLMLFQAGDMVSRYTPGFEGAALSGVDAAEHILQLLAKYGTS